MPHASHRLDLLVVASQPSQMVDEERVKALFHGWNVNELGQSDHLDQVIEGGCARVWLDRPGRTILYANLSGGFRAQCAGCGHNLAGPFGVAYRAWKLGASRSLVCPGCGSDQPLETVVLKPPGAFSPWAIVFSDVESTTLNVEAQQEIEAAVGDYRVILRRP